MGKSLELLELVAMPFSAVPNRLLASRKSVR